MEHRSDRRLKILLQAFAEGGDLEEHQQNLKELQRLSAEHFLGEEEGDGFFEQLESQSPSSQRRTRALRLEHQAMSCELEAMLALAADLREREQAFVARFRRHEKSEIELLNQVLYIDHGGGD